jgi:serine/threonine-protein kinase
MPALETGVRLGPYEILGPLRAGGMGDVYRARDTRLGRTVAVKLINAELSADPHSRERFEREARIIGGLTHPNICALHDVGEHDGDRFLVMELLEGQTLATRIAGAPHGLPIGETLDIAAQIVDALAFAHLHHIVHRDIKPANIMLTPVGVKLLDFGVARLRRDPEPEAAATRTQPLITAEHTVVGTLAYMAPEQLNGQADERSDIFAFGAVLFEMLTGQRAFQGSTSSAVIAAIVQPEPPDARALRPGAPPGVYRLLRRCLTKDRDTRWQSAADLADELRWLASADSSTPGEATATSRARPSLATPVLAALIAATLAGVASWAILRPSPRSPAGVMRLEIIPSPADPINVGTTTPTLAISRDGRRIAYASGTEGGGGPLIVRDVGELVPRRLEGAARARDPFFSPDGQWIGYCCGRLGLTKIPASGGTPVEITPLKSVVRGASWADDGTIVFASVDAGTGLMRVSDAGGPVSVLTRPNRDLGEANHVLPVVLPGGRGILFTILDAAADNPRVALLDTRDQSQRVLIPGAAGAFYVNGGYLVYAAAGNLFAVRFNLDALRVEGQPQTLVNGVLMGTVMGAYYAVSPGGSLAYVPATATTDSPRTLVWVDRHGIETPLNAPPRAYRSVRLSPDGRRIAVSINDQQRDVWTWDLERETLTQITADPRQDLLPVWSPDGQRLIFQSRRDGGGNLYWQQSDGTGTAHPLTTGVEQFIPTSVTPDGAMLLGNSSIPKAYTLFALPLAKRAPPQPLLPSPASNIFPAVSPNGRLLAYQSNESGQSEIYVRPFPDVDAARLKVSNGGEVPVWSRDGRELFFLSSGRLTVARVEAAGTPRAGVPAQVLSTSYLGGPSSFDVAPDGRRFLMIKEDPRSRPPNTPIVMVLNVLESIAPRTPSR